MKVSSVTPFRAADTHRIRLSQVPPQMSLWRHQHPAVAQTSPVTNQNKGTAYRGGDCDRHREVLTHFISMTENSLPVMNIRRGTVRMRTKGRASEKGLIFTTHRTARQRSWIRVNKCIRIVFTCTEMSGQQQQTWRLALSTTIQAGSLYQENY